MILGQERGGTVDKATVEQLEGELNHVLDDLCYYFRSPDPTGHTHDSLNQLLCRLKERQNLFRNHVSQSNKDATVVNCRAVVYNTMCKYWRGIPL